MRLEAGTWADAVLVAAPMLEGDPVPWARAGRRGGRSFTPRAYAEHREALSWAMRQAYAGVPLVGDVGLHLRFYRRNRRPVDLDRLVNAVCDAGTALIWADDRQVRLLVAELAIDPARPRTELVIYTEQA